MLIGLLWDDDAPPPAAGVVGDVEGTDAAGEQTPADPAATPAPDAAPQTPGSVEPPVEPPVTGETPPPEPDLGTPVAVFNSTSVQGLAADAAETLEDAGWTEVEPANFTGGSLAVSTVRYGDPAVEVSARAVADALGITAVELAESDAVDGIEVVLELDYTR